MKRIRTQLLPEVYLTCLPAAKFKTDFLSAQFVTPLRLETAGLGALLPAVLERGTQRYPDMQQLTAAEDLLYGANISHSVRKRGESQLWGFVATAIDDAYTPGGERLLEPLTELVGELLCDPCVENGLLRGDYTASEKTNLIDLIRSTVNDKRTFAGKRLLEEMCRGEAYGVSHLGEEEAVGAITPSILTTYYRRQLAAGRLELYYCGKAEPARVEDAFRQTFEGLRREEVAPISPVPHHRGPSEVRVVQERMDVSQGKLCLGYSVDSVDKDAVLVMNMLFGGTSNSKLFLNVREKLSLCYYASSAYHRSKTFITVSTGIESQNYQKAMDEIAHQLNAIQRGEWEDWEFSAAMSSLKNAYKAIFDSASQLEDFYMGQIASGQDREPEEMLQDILTVTPERVVEAAKTVRLDTVYFLTGKEERDNG